jgi:hypothetical protein
MVGTTVQGCNLLQGRNDDRGHLNAVGFIESENTVVALRREKKTPG